MTFRAFEELVKAKYPEAEVFAHGEFSGNKINVAIIFQPRSVLDPYTLEWTGKVYKYNGTYCEVLNRLGIKAIYSHDLENARRYLQHLKDTNGEENIFTGEAMDYTDEISHYTALIETYEKEYIIV